MSALAEDPAGQAIELRTGCSLADLRAKLLAQAKRLTKNSGDAEDLVQDILARFTTQGIPDHIADPIAYMRTALSNGFYSDRRRAQTRRETLSDMDHHDGPAASPTVHELATASLIRQDIATALDSLTPAVREVAQLLIDWEGGGFQRMSQGDAAAALGISVDAVKDRLREARRQLRKLLEPYKGELG
ncbi:RNA polymerase sigma factor [Kutzneria sp. 744]|uniref:RNA polymerase sigma factor n=1 Tax=Kutzneria sp. (strain 744) TaxID=345341 RepID=UPI0003EECEDA|nr:RNA polymerase sigma factor [Kutzneria sp. 744]EWM12213.1 RNA polymerase sigma-70 factor [Kutzneria sp. 744]